MRMRMMLLSAAVMVAAVLTGCGGSGNDGASPAPSALPSASAPSVPAATASPSMSSVPSTAIPAVAETNCHLATDWTRVPSNFAFAPIAERLGVPVDDVKRGVYGSATCEEPVSEDAIGGPQSPVVMVYGRGNCQVVGTKDMPQPGGRTRDVLAVCPWVAMIIQPA